MKSDDSIIRLLRRSDLADAMSLKDAAGWNHTREDWLRLMTLSPDGCFAMECDGKVVATATALCYGQDLAWIGMVLTAPAYRGRGFGRRLMQRVMEFLDRKSVRHTGLDATAMGEGLYCRLGFKAVTAVERWVRTELNTVIDGKEPLPNSVNETGALSLCVDRGLDRAAFGADRIALLAALAGGVSASVDRAGYAMGRPGSEAAYFGPCISCTASGAAVLAVWCLSHSGIGPVYWDLLPENEAAVKLARQLGFSPVRKLTRMSISRQGGASPGLKADHSLVYAIAGLELG